MAIHVVAPGSSANVGPGFDALGIAVDLPFELTTGESPGFHVAEPTHPAAVAFAALGGDAPLWWRSPIPPGRGMGYSGAARAAGAYAALLTRGSSGGDARQQAFECAASLEGHPDNAAASVFGGITVSVDSTVVPVVTPLELGLVVWWPATTTSTTSSRAALPESVPFSDAVFNVGHASLLVAALAAGDRDALGRAVHDRLHEPHRLASMPASEVAMDAFAGAPVIGCWLSGSGPTVAALVERSDAVEVAGRAPGEGTVRILDIVQRGVHAIGGDTTEGNS